MTAVVQQRSVHGSVTRRRMMAQVAGGLGATVVMAACGGPGASGSTAGTTAPAGGGLNQTASLVWLNWEANPTQVEGNGRAVRTFQEKFPKITVENAAQSGSYWDKLSSLKAAGTPPDLWEWEPKHVVDYVMRKQVVDLQPLVARDKGGARQGRSLRLLSQGR